MASSSPQRLAARCGDLRAALGLRHLGTLLLTDDADTLAQGAGESCSTSSPGYTTDPTRAFYTTFGYRRPGGHRREQQAEINQLAELAQIGGEP